MHDSGAIEFDKNRGSVEPGPNIERFYEYLDQPEPSPRPWSKYYLAYAVTCTVAVTGAVLFFEAVVNVLFALSIAGFVAIAAVHGFRSEG
jgi:hypothetical protein